MLYRPFGFHGVLDPYNSQPIIGQVLLYRAWTSTVGIAHRAPLTLAHAALHLAVVSFVYVMARRRVGQWPALGVAILVLFMGRAWEALLFPGALNYGLATLAACVTWSVLDCTPGVRAQLALAGLLGVAGLSSGLIPAVLAGLIAETVAFRAWRRLWIVAAAAAPMTAWYVLQANIDHVVAGAGRASLHLAANLEALPLWAVKLVGAAAGAAVGLPPEGGPAVAAVVVIGLVLWRRTARLASRFPTPRALGLAVTLVTVVLLTGAARADDTAPSSSRYMYFLAIVLLLLACEGAAGLRVTRQRIAAIAGAGIVAMATLLGVAQLRHGKTLLRREADGTAARMGALRFVDRRAPANFQAVEPSGLRYSPVVVDNIRRRYGDASIHSATRLERALPESRAAADQVLVSALVSRAHRAPANCRSFAGAAGALPRGDRIVAVRAARPTILELRRFADAGRGVNIPVAQLREVVLRVADVEIARPWRLRGPGAVVRVCPGA